MQQVPDIHSQRTDPLQLDRCPDCGYLLTGLPQEGQCPECGFAYTADMIVLYGWGFGHSATMVNRKWTPGWLGCALAPFGLLMAGATWVLVNTMGLAWSWGSWQALLLVLPLLLPCLIPTVQLIFQLKALAVAVFIASFTNRFFGPCTRGIHGKFLRGPQDDNQQPRYQGDDSRPTPPSPTGDRAADSSGWAAGAWFCMQ